MKVTFLNVSASAIVLSLPLAARAAQTTSAASGQTVTVTAGEHYKAGGWHRFFLGDDYRDLWTTPVRVPVLDLRTFAGGLRPVMRVGGQETKGLALKGADGRDYTFRWIDKDPSAILPEDLRGSIADKLVQDQIAAAHPASPLVATPLLEAAGVPHVSPRLVVMPDDPALGEFRSDFANLVGIIEDYPQPAKDGVPGFGGSTEIVSGIDMLKRLRESPRTRADAKAFLRARLMDVFMGDWDRHLKQWRWAQVPGKPQWQPVPEDRDQAFSRFEGLVLTLGRARQPRFVDFGPKYPSIIGLTFNGWDQDRRLLSELEKPAWDETAADLKARLTDAVIDEAVRQLPPEYYAKDGARMVAAIKARRDALPAEATRYYLHLAHDVYVEGTDSAEVAQIRRFPDGDVEVTLSPADGGSGGAGEPPQLDERARIDSARAKDPFFRRRFHPSETSEVRIDLRGGNDRAVVSGGHGGPIKVRVVGGSGDDVLDDSAAGGTRFSDSAGARVVRGPGTRFDDQEYVPPPPPANAPWIPPRDWGRRTLTQAIAGGTTDLGLVLGLQVTTEAYGFRKDPYASKQIFRGAFAFGAANGRVDYDGEFRKANSGVFTHLFARASGIEVLRFYGFGNESSSAGDDESFKVNQKEVALAPSMGVFLTPHLTFSLGPRLRYANTDLAPGRFVTETQPYGVEGFGEFGFGSDLQLDTRDFAPAATRGVLFDVGGNFFPAWWDVRSSFGELHGDLSTYLTAGSGTVQPTLALRAGGKRVWGDYPFFEAASIGGSRTVRGFRAQRFAGDSSLYGNAELRIRLARVLLLLPGELGVFGLADAGRVYLAGETSDKWHTSAGGGLWFAFLNRNATFTMSVAASEERTGFYIHAGFIF